MIISLVVAAAANNVIGRDNRLLWRLPNDLKFFRDTTWAMPVVMGRKTFESLSGKALKGRMNIVITRQSGWTAEGVSIAHDLDEAIALAAKANYEELFVIGGGEIYREAMNRADRIYLTRVYTEIAGDTFFPVIAEQQWELASEERMEADAKHAYAYSFQLWKRK
ncbi:dihydrofolate reductase [Hydrobacter penzbergensis]|uniref:Dihydrofolate reductase n=1 Tax=Hydrobacter penzbergensis TaxID=1235997 RepID=A0A8X8LD07_9BACT|nr:dihydrofolate reductase [Hydrobacter penzbergensis]SDW25758.1 dihydrofolate reductase [Hydrobacter penzbergensis]